MQKVMQQYWAANIQTEAETNQKRLAIGVAIFEMRSQTEAFCLLLLTAGVLSLEESSFSLLTFYSGNSK